MCPGRLRREPVERHERLLAALTAATTLLLQLTWFSGCGGQRQTRAARPALRSPVRCQELRDPSDLYLAGEFERASEAYRSLVVPGDRSPGQAYVLYWLGRSEYALGRMGEARSCAERALAALESDKPEGPEEQLETGLPDADDLRAYTLTLLADVLLAQKRPAESIALLDRLRREGLEGLSGTADEMLFRRAAALEGAGRHEAARRAFRRLARNFPRSPLAHQALARARNTGRPVYEARAGVFEKRPSAEARARALRSRGFRPRVEAVTGRDGRRYLVSLGRFARREDAERARRRAALQGFDSEVSVREAP
jgi:tetratricopeptide (TPR) repeat protein